MKKLTRHTVSVRKENLIMSKFIETTHLSEILENSQKTPVIIFKFSETCGSSARLSKNIENLVLEGKINSPIYKIVVQKHSVLSQKIADWFSIKHESPQIILLKNKKVLYTGHHSNIDLDKLK